MSEQHTCLRLARVCCTCRLSRLLLLRGVRADQLPVRRSYVRAPNASCSLRTTWAYSFLSTIKRRRALNVTPRQRRARCVRLQHASGRRCSRQQHLRVRPQAKHRSFDVPHTLHRGATASDGHRDERAQEAVNRATPLRFMPASVWKGARPGYMFGRGVHGQGYYADAAQGDRWRESRAPRQEPTRAERRSRSRSRSRERRKRGADAPAPAAFDDSKLEGSLSRKQEQALSDEERRAAALARLAERRQAGAGARPGGHAGGARW